MFTGQLWYNSKCKGGETRLKNFIMKHIIDKDKIESMGQEQLQKRVLTFLALLVFPIIMAAQVGITHSYNMYKARDKENILERCRLKAVIPQGDGSQSYICKGIKSKKDYYIIEGESLDLDKNPYMNRPVKIYKDGSVK